MLALLQRVSQASVEVEGKIIGAIDKGLCVFLGVEKNDTQKELERLVERVIGYRIFPDDKDRMNCNVKEASGSILVVPQFTLAADTKKGMRPSFTPAALPEIAEKMFHTFSDLIEKANIPVAKGQFGAYMQVNLTNDGPVTFLINS